MGSVQRTDEGVMYWVMYQAWNYWALVSVAESKTLFEITKEECLKEREMGYLATVPRIC